MGENEANGLPQVVISRPDLRVLVIHLAINYEVVVRGVLEIEIRSSLLERNFRSIKIQD